MNLPFHSQFSSMSGSSSLSAPRIVEFPERFVVLLWEAAFGYLDDFSELTPQWVDVGKNPVNSIFPISCPSLYKVCLEDLNRLAARISCMAS